MGFSTTAVSVLLLVAMAVPGYLLIKTKMLPQKAITYLSVLLLYVSQPFLSIRSFLEVSYTLQLAVNLAIVFGVSLAGQAVVFGVMWLVLRRRFDDPQQTAELIRDGFIGGDSYTAEPALKAAVARSVSGRANRAMVLASAFGNVGFFGVPVLQFLFPDAHDAIAYSAVFIVTLNLMSWTVGSYLLTGDKKHVSLKRALINPQTVTLVISLPLFFAGVSAGDLPDTINTVIGYLADMTAPLCMIILGMRFALAPVVQLFTDFRVYVASFIKTLVFPLLVYVVLMPFQMEEMLRVSLVLLSGMPAATINLNLAELYGADQKTAANSILMSTVLSIVTIPLLMLLF
ncbi:MAG TPA: AEC family transporter [Candidatus Limadaptatus stercorigallinarum]|uniref:AEC family transporter n=1 Tax=Candidatus Limadaptatus stercorigallinarum TaxID=2840845 RepID=A0A9D1HQX8_9FIRM|nr:AEC family transporter [Candidatus Limadaptatus stercorigallinarum]